LSLHHLQLKTIRLTMETTGLRVRLVDNVGFGHWQGVMDMTGDQIRSELNTLDDGKIIVTMRKKHK
jgi:hypothetical protein